jgi:fatty acid desaturase
MPAADGGNAEGALGIFCPIGYNRDMSVTDAPDSTEFLTQKQLKELSKVSSTRAAGAIVFEWSVIVGTVLVAARLHNVATSILAIIIIASRQHALAILMHEACHRHLFKNVRRGYLISNLFLAYPLSISTTVYRHRHIQHHSHTNSEEDPDFVMQAKSKEWIWPKSKRDAVVVFIRDIVGLNILDSMKILNYWSPMPGILGRDRDPRLKLPLSEKILFPLVNLAALALIFYFKLWLFVVLYWVIPLVTFLSLFTRVRAISEHMGTRDQTELGRTRHVQVGVLEKFLIAPLNINHHLTHHLYPSIPFHNLPKATRLLTQHARVRNDGEFSKGYFNTRQGVMSKVITR